MTIDSNQILTLSHLSIPRFEPEGYNLLKGFNPSVPKGTNTLAERVEEFQAVTKDLDKNTTWNKVVPWVVAAVEISLIAATILTFLFAGPFGAIPLVALGIFDIVSACGGEYNGGMIFPPFGGIFYMNSLVSKQHQLEERQKVLSQELPAAIEEAASFWQSQGTKLLEKVEAAKNIPFSESTPADNESIEQKAARLKEDSKKAKAAHHRQVTLENLATVIKLGQIYLGKGNFLKSSAANVLGKILHASAASSSGSR